MRLNELVIPDFYQIMIHGKPRPTLTQFKNLKNEWIFRTLPANWHYSWLFYVHIIQGVIFWIDSKQCCIWFYFTSISLFQSTDPRFCFSQPRVVYLYLLSSPVSKPTYHSLVRFPFHSPIPSWLASQPLSDPYFLIHDPRSCLHRLLCIDYYVVLHRLLCIVIRGQERSDHNLTSAAYLFLVWKLCSP